MTAGRPNPRYSNGARRRAIRARWEAIGAPCALCGRPIDYDLPAGHPMAFEVDEVVPVSRGGDPLDFANTQPAHRICNQRKGNGRAVAVATSSRDAARATWDERDEETDPTDGRGAGSREPRAGLPTSRDW